MLAQDLLTRMAENHADFTLTFRLLCATSAGTEGDVAVRALFADGSAYDTWAARRRRRMTDDTMAPAARSAAMRAVNPAYIPRNFQRAMRYRPLINSLVYQALTE